MELTDDSIFHLGTVNMHITFGNESCYKTILTRFMVVDILLAYNTIIGWLTLSKLKVVVSSYKW